MELGGANHLRQRSAEPVSCRRPSEQSGVGLQARLVLPANNPLRSDRACLDQVQARAALPRQLHHVPTVQSVRRGTGGECAEVPVPQRVSDFGGRWRTEPDFPHARDVCPGGPVWVRSPDPGSHTSDSPSCSHVRHSREADTQSFAHWSAAFGLVNSEGCAEAVSWSLGTSPDWLSKQSELELSRVSADFPHSTLRSPRLRSSLWGISTHIAPTCDQPKCDHERTFAAQTSTATIRAPASSAAVGRCAARECPGCQRHGRGGRASSRSAGRFRYHLEHC